MNIIAVTSGKGGAGKSCVAAYTGIALAKAGKKVLLAELGADMRSIDMIVGEQDKVLFDIADCIADRCEIERAIIDTGHKNMSLLSGAVYPNMSAADESFFRRLIKESSSQFDYLIADGIDFSLTSPGHAHMILMVTTPDTLCIRACSTYASALYDTGAENIRLIINDVPAQVLPMQDLRDFDDVIDGIGARLIGVIPTSPKLRYSSNNAERLNTDSLTVQIFDNIAARICGESRPLLVR